MVNRCVSQWVKFTHQTIGIFLCVVFCDCKTKDRVKSFEKHERIEKKKNRSHITGRLQAEEGVHKSMKRCEGQVKQLSVKPPTLEGFLSQH